MRFTHVHTHTQDDEAHNPRLRYDAYTLDERYARDCDVSGSWREEYAAQGVDPDAHEHELVTDGGGRPDDCICWDDDAALPCFPCARDGFSDPNPSEPEADTDVAAYPATIGEADSTDSENQAVATDGGEDGDPTLGDFIADGGRTKFTVPEPGEIVRDRDRDRGDGDQLLVITATENTISADEYIEQLDATVADVNPKYSPLAPTATCVYVDEIDAFDPEATLEEIRHAIADGDLRSYTFPVDRLASGSGGDDR
jgi:hypothetical protein